MRLIRNQVYPQGYRGFESLSLRFLSPRLIANQRSDRGGFFVHESGEMTEWSKVHDWKSCVLKRHRGFESLSLRKKNRTFLLDGERDYGQNQKPQRCMAASDGKSMNPARPGTEQR